MIVNLFRHTQAISILSILGLCIFLWMGISFHEVAINSDFKNPLFDVLFKQIMEFKFLQRIVVTVLVFWHCVFFNKIIVGQKILSSNSFYPAFFYLIILSLSPKALYLSPELCAISFLLLAIHKTLTCYLSKDAYTSVFELSLYFSIAAILHPPLVLFLPLSWIGMSIFSLGEWRHWTLSLLGIVCPWVILISLNSYLNIPQLHIANFYSFLFTAAENIQLTTLDRIELVGLVILTLVCINELLTSVGRKNIKSRKSNIFILWFFPFSILYIFLNPSNLWLKLLVLTIPITAVISNYFYYSKRTNWLNFIGISLLTFLFINHIYNFN